MRRMFRHGQLLPPLPHCSAQLDAEGFYPVEGNRWKKGEELYLPLYEGKMMQAFDHRAASVVPIHEGNHNRIQDSRSGPLTKNTATRISHLVRDIGLARRDAETAIRLCTVGLGFQRLARRRRMSER